MKLTAAHLLSVPVTFRIALARILYSQHIFVQLSDPASDLTGTGEGVLYRAKPHIAGALLARQVRPALEALSPQFDRDVWRDQLRQWAATEPGVAYALDSAWLDLQARREGCTVAQWLGGPARQSVPVTEQLFIAGGAALDRQLDEILRRGTRHLKLKIGSNPESDVALVRQVRERVRPAVELRVDANHAYTWPAAASLYRRLAELGVRAFEEPLQVRDWSGLRALRRELGVPVILDESILTLEQLQAAIAAEAIDLLNVKLTRVGGITLAQEYIELCSRHGIGVLIGCTEDLGIGTAAILHLATALPACDSMEGLGPQRLGLDVAAPPWQICDGALTLPAGPGLGVELAPNWLDRLPRRVKHFDLLRPDLRLRLFSEGSRLQQRVENVRVRLTRRLGR
ncbi:MAG TPA: mandelate racemase/muconate lactonizing enzyme family protein [Caldilineaceae bacterium]|nr:mandelate racemase/muconate lactonizing enzyme family protein [Caldilineaceae bacterium]